MSSAPIRLIIIVASTRNGRLSPTIANWFATLAGSRDDMAVEVLDLADARLPDMLTAERPPAVQVITPRLAAADAFVVVTPEYNYSFPAPLKTLIDWHTREWRAKPVGFVSLGGLAGGLRAVEHLRQVFAELHAVTVRDTVSFHMAWTQFDSDGRPNDGEGTTRAAHVMLDELAWWAEAVRDARARRPSDVAAGEAAA
jgi:NAD(P)H-dependent FMN reductase